MNDGMGNKKIKIGVFSDVHGNFEALKAVMKKIKKLEPEKIIYLGDAIGYGADPVKCWERISAECDVVLKGNHEAMAVEEIDDSKCSELGQISSSWTKRQIEKRELDKMKGLPETFRFENMLFCHSGCTKSGKWKYYNESENLVKEFADQNANVIFTAHTHRPRIVITDKDNNIIYDRYIKKRKTIFHIDLSHYRVIVNTGSVGQQRDCRTDASFVILSVNESMAEVRFSRIGYNRILAYLKIVYCGAGKKIANYLIREDWRRTLYENFADRCKWIFGKICKNSIK